MVQRLSREERDYTLAHLSPAQIDEWDARGHLVHLAEADRFAARLRAFINREVPVTGAALEGNHVILKLDHGVFAAYVHLVPGSVRVHRGERVRDGVLGKLGNSGASSGPHLHFQLMDHPSILDADGLPFVLDRFELDGRVPSLQALIDADASAPPVPPVPIDPSARGSFRHRGLSELDVVTLPTG